MWILFMMFSVMKRQIQKETDRGCKVVLDPRSSRPVWEALTVVGDAGGFFTFCIQRSISFKEQNFFCNTLKELACWTTKSNHLFEVSSTQIVPELYIHLSFIDNRSSRTFSSGSSRHGNAQRAPVDWNWVNLMMQKRRKTRKQNNLKKLPTS